MNKNKIFTLIIVATSLLLALQNSSLVADAYSSIRYGSAFNQNALYKKYRNLMERLGCAENVFQSDKDSITQKTESFTQKENSYEPWSSDNPQDVQELASFQKECLNLLNYKRRITLIEPAFGALGDVAFMGLASGLIYSLSIDSIRDFLKKKNLGAVKSEESISGAIKQESSRNKESSVASDFAASSAVYTALGSLKNISGVGYNLIYSPNNSLEDIENYFAQNKCFIPRTLWPKIIKEFIAARHDGFGRELHTNFLNFALGFTIYKPKSVVHFKDNMSREDIKNELSRRIDLFFSDYTDKQDILFIKINVSKFIDQLIDTGNSKITVQAPRYIYLFGSGGIGKTHFVQTLSTWIDELIPNSVLFEDLVINSSTDLEGSPDSPGAFLKVLRNQLIQNKRGSVIIIDEATWLNDGGMVSPAKRIFNGDRSRLTTSYFGTNMDGTGVSLEIPPALIFVASNEPIIDPALRSRFDTVFYPVPLQDALVEHAYKVAEKSIMLKNMNYTIDKELIRKWVAWLDEKNRNFRFVAGNVEAFLLANQK